jgi:hypothetical protein
MVRRAGHRIVIEGADRQGKALRPGFPDKLQRGPAALSECSAHARRGSIRREVAFPGQKCKVRPTDFGVGAKRSSVRFSTLKAVTIRDASRAASNLVADTAAQTTTADHLRSFHLSPTPAWSKPRSLCARPQHDATGSHPEPQSLRRSYIDIAEAHPRYYPTATRAEPGASIG